MPDARIDLASVVVPVEQQVSAELEEEVVLLNMNDNKYYGLNGIGAFIWRSIEKCGRVSTIVEDVLASYEVSREHCEEDVLDFLRELSDAGLIRVMT